MKRRGTPNGTLRAATEGKELKQCWCPGNRKEYHTPKNQYWVIVSFPPCAGGIEMPNDCTGLLGRDLLVMTLCGD